MLASSLATRKPADARLELFTVLPPPQRVAGSIDPGGLDRLGRLFRRRIGIDDDRRGARAAKSAPAVAVDPSPAPPADNSQDGWFTMFIEGNKVGYGRTRPNG